MMNYGKLMQVTMTLVSLPVGLFPSSSLGILLMNKVGILGAFFCEFPVSHYYSTNTFHFSVRPHFLFPIKKTSPTCCNSMNHVHTWLAVGIWIPPSSSTCTSASDHGSEICALGGAIISLDLNNVRTQQCEPKAESACHLLCSQFIWTKWIEECWLCPIGISLNDHMVGSCGLNTVRSLLPSNIILYFRKILFESAFISS